jgi:hypothetical protein
MTIDERNIRAALNNAQWCDTVCRSHGRPGEFFDDIWINRQAAPTFCPNAVTLSGATLEPIKMIRQLTDLSIGEQLAIKDSFSRLDLTACGFGVQFEARWIYLRTPRIGAHAVADVRREIFSSAKALNQWETAWRRCQSGVAKEEIIFMPGLLEERDIAVVAAYREDRIISGSIASRSHDVVGWSNLFAPADDALAYAAVSLSAIGEVFPGLPIVGYANGDELDAAHALGFETMGPFRVWMRDTSE